MKEKLQHALAYLVLAAIIVGLFFLNGFSVDGVHNGF
jgi:hypothetical protein